MTMFSYKALNPDGSIVKNMQHASSEAELEQQLKRSGAYLIIARKIDNKPLLADSIVAGPELILFYLSLEQLLRSGVPLLESLADLHQSMDNPHFCEIIAAMADAIGNGATLSQAMAKHPEAFDQVSVSLVHAGEASGRLSEVFGKLAESLKWQDELAAQTRTMMIYPIFVGVIVIAVSFFLAAYLMPQLLGFIKGAGQDIPLQTRLLLAASDLLTHYWYVLLILPVLTIVALRQALHQHPKLQYSLDKLKLYLWPTGAILHKIILARFANSFAMMYTSGISVLDCIANSRGLVGNQVIAHSLDQVRREVEAGKNLTRSFHDTGLFPPLVIRMLKVGETTGQLDDALRNVSYFYEREAREAIRRLQSLLEPAMTITLGLLLGWVMLAVLSPIYDLIGKATF